jgi:hypothetical protein
MTTINVATDIPTNINTLEKLLVWAGNCFHNLNGEVTVTEGVNITQYAAQSNPYFIAGVNLHRQVNRQSIELDPGFSVGGLKPWAYAKELSTKVLTAEMKAN